jgi:hypothetical protein
MAPHDSVKILCKSSIKRYDSIKDLPKFLKADMQREIDDQQVSEIRSYLKKNKFIPEAKTKQIGPPLGIISLGKYKGSLVCVFQVINKNKQVPDYILKAENKPLIELLKQISIFHEI